MRGSGDPLGCGRASGKAILVGEHFVVHGGPALAVPIAASIEVQLTNTWSGPEIGVAGVVAMLAELGLSESVRAAAISGLLPLGAGLGGSAALAAALLRALGVAEGIPLAEAIHRCEKVAHGRPSGLDGLTVALGRPVWMPAGVGVGDGPLGRAGDAEVLLGDGWVGLHDAVGMGSTQTGFELPLMVAVVPRRGTTREAVAKVAAFKSNESEWFEALAQVTAELAHKARAHLMGRDWTALGRVMDAAHVPLEALGLVSPEQTVLVEAARRAGALGAKLSGAGLGGAVIVLRDETCTVDLEVVLRQAGAMQVFVSTPGAR